MHTGPGGSVLSTRFRHPFTGPGEHRASFCVILLNARYIALAFRTCELRQPRPLRAVPTKKIGHPGDPGCPTQSVRIVKGNAPCDLRRINAAADLSGKIQLMLDGVLRRHAIPIKPAKAVPNRNTEAGNDNTDGAMLIPKTPVGRVADGVSRMPPTTAK